METRASYIAVGSFVLLLMAGLLGFALWLSVIGGREDTERYIVFFEGSVTGLNVGSAVRLSGIEVGEVAAIALDEQQIGRVRTVLEVAADTPVEPGIAATLELQGLTGGVFIQLEYDADEAADRPIREVAGEPYPVIPSTPSPLEQVYESVPELLAEATRILSSLQALVSEENLRTVTEILVNVQSLTEALDAETRDLGRLTARLDATLENVNALVVQLTDDSGRLTEEATETLGAVRGQTAQVGNEVAEMAAAFAATAEELEGLIGENRAAIGDFAQSGLYELTLTLGELRQLADNLSRVAARFERGGATLFFGDTNEGRPIQ